MKKVTDRPDCAADVVVKLSEMFLHVSYGNVVNQYGLYGEFRRMLIEDQWVSVHRIRYSVIHNKIMDCK